MLKHEIESEEDTPLDMGMPRFRKISDGAYENTWKKVERSSSSVINAERMAQKGRPCKFGVSRKRAIK
jgi:hypothetical protein